MADRDVTVSLRAQVAGFVAGIKTAQTSFKGFNDDLERSFKKRRALSELGTAAGVMGAAAAAGLGLMIKASADFDSAMSNVEATGADAKRNMDALREAAIKAGESTKFSATEAAAGIENLLKAGVKSRDVIGGGLAGALDLAAAGEIEVGEAAEIAATAMTQFSLKGKDVPHVADLLAAGAGKAQGDVADMAMALKQSGLVASQMGLSVEETTGTLTAFASAGLLGSDAGTAFRTMLLRLANPTKESAELMGELGLTAYDANGNFVGMRDLAGQLQDKLGGLTQKQRDQALAQLFGNDAIRAANVLFKQGEDGIRKWTRAVNDQGFAAETAATRMDNLKGDFEELQGALETALIGSGEAGQGPLRDLLQLLTKVVRAYNGLPDPIKNSSAALLGFAAVLGGGVFVGTKTLTGIAAARESLADLGVSSDKTKGKLAGLGRGLGILGASVGALHVLQGISAASDDAAPKVNALALSLLKIGEDGGARGKLIEDFDDIKDHIDRLADRNPAQKLEDTLGDMIGFTAGDVRRAETDISALDSALTDLANVEGPSVANRALEQFARTMDLSAKETKQLRSLLPGFQEALGASRLEAERSARAERRHANATEDSKDEVVDETKAIRENIKAHNKRADMLLAAIDAEIGWEQAVDDAAKEARKGTKTLDTNTQAGRDNKTALIGMAEAWNNLPDKTKRAEGGVKSARQEFIKIAREMGASKEQARRLSNELLDIPNPKRTVDVDTEKARKKVNELVPTINRKLADIDDENVSVNFTTDAAAAFRMVGSDFDAIKNFAAGNRAMGGRITGPGTGMSDTAGLFALSNGEFVVREKVARRMYPFLEALNAGQAEATQAAGLRDGGRVDINMLAQTRRAAGDARFYSDGMSRITSMMAGALSKELSGAFNKMFALGGVPLGPGGSLSTGQILRGQQFLRGQDGKPYSWGGVGPFGYDCSGIQSAGLNAAFGRYPYSRLGSTGTAPWTGSRPGVGRYTIGWFTGSPGHMSGNIGGLGVESAGGVGVRLGSDARSPLDSMFNGVMHFDRGGPLKPGVTIAVNGTGRNERVLTDEQRNRPIHLTGQMTFELDGQVVTGVMRGIAREEIADEFAYMGRGA